MNFPVDLIIRKRDGNALSPDEIRALILSYTRGDVPDYQMSAFLMAAFLRGLNEAETSALTDAMLYSGDVLDLSGIPGTKVDKHSTGGVGDKVSLVLAPVVAACGVPVPMISGRGLGYTGGTLDKLESIPGFRVALSVHEYARQLERIGLVMMGQTDEIAPADRKLYALRDVTGTVEFIPFIAASIMSKKLAAGIDALVLDVKCGRGAFMKERNDARRLTETMVEIGERFGKQTVAWLTAMDVPLGYAIGNWPEVEESIHCLRGEVIPDISELTLALAGEMLHLGRVAESPEQGRKLAQQAITSGAALDTFAALIEAQGGDLSILEPGKTRPGIPDPIEVRAPESATGYVADIDALIFGQTAVALGAGRTKKEDPVDPTAGIVLTKRPGDPVEPGEILARIYTHRMHSVAVHVRTIQSAFSFSATPPPIGSILLERYSAAGWTTSTSSESAVKNR